MERVFVDSSAWLAHVNRRDHGHSGVADALLRFQGRLVTSNFVFDEAVTLCMARLGHGVAVALGDLLRDPAVVDLVAVDASTETSAWELFLKRSDKQYSFTDCTSFVLMSALEIGTAVALDDDFRREGFALVP